MRRTEILGALARLDKRLDAALSAFDAAQDGQTSNRFRGLVISPDEPRRLLARAPGASPFAGPAKPDALWPGTRGTFARQLASSFRLSAFELDTLLIAVAPEFDLRYERIYAYLQDDVTKKRPTVDFVLNLLCDETSDRWSHLEGFDADAPLVRHGLISVLADPQQAATPLLGRTVVAADEKLVRQLLGLADRPVAASTRPAQPPVSAGDGLAAFATRIDPRAEWDDLVLPADALAQLRELCTRVNARARVFDDWGFGRKLSRGRGTAALFSGGSGTGKTMAAEVIANTLGLEIFRINLAGIVSKYIGDTEKQLERVFAAAASANAILFFDEADALFGKRSEVKDAHDRYANIEVSYLLQKMEDYDGLAILATNLADHLDAAFTRRLAAHIYFPFPDASARLEIWKRAWPREVPIAADVDLPAIARDIKVAGGGIKNIALAAAFAAAGNGGVVDRAHVMHAVRREHQKSGRASELGPGFGGGLNAGGR